MSIQDIAKKGRYGDNHLLHVSDAELQGLNALANDIYGHGLTQNPDTGLPEAFLFAPFLAPLIAGSGASALGVGLTAGALGTAEAAARGMDDPLAQGMMAGLTAGAGSAISGSLGNIGAEAAGQTAGNLTGAAIPEAATTAMQDVGLSQLQGVDPSLLANATTTAPVSTMPQVGSEMLQTTGSMPDTSTFMSRNLPNFGQPFNPMPSMQNVGRGIEEVINTPGVGKEFMKQNTGAMVAGAAGIGGQAQLDAQQKMREEADAMDASKRAKYDAMVNRIKQNYADVGRPLPTNPYGSLFGGPQGFKEGKEVKPEYYGDGRYLPDWVREHAKNDVEKFAFGGVAGKGRFINSKTGEPESLAGRMAEVQGLSGSGSAVQGAGSDLDQKIAAFLKALKSKGGMKRPGFASGGYLEGGIASLKGDGMSDSVPAKIDGSQPAALSTGEYVIPADVVSHLGNGSSDDGAVRLDEMLDRVRVARTGTEKQAPQIKPDKYLPA